MPTEEPFLPRLEALLQARGRFGHREHLELAWGYLADGDATATARTQMEAAIRHVAAKHGQPDRYHHTMTMTWLRLVELHRAGDPAATFDEFIDRNERLLDKGLLGRHFSPDRLGAPQARAGLVEPDLRPLPAGV